MSTYGSGTYGSGTYGDPTPGTPAASPQVSTLTPLSLGVEIEGPDGIVARFSAEEVEAGRLIQGLSFNSQRTGFGAAQVSLARDVFDESADTEIMQTIRFRDVTGHIVWEGQLRTRPGGTADFERIDLQAVGFRNRFESKPVTAVLVDRRMENWSDAPIERRAAILSAGDQYGTGFNAANERGRVIFSRERDRAIQEGTALELWYSAPPGTKIARVQYAATEANGTAETGRLGRSDNLDGSGGSSATLTHGSLQTAELGPPTRHVWLRSEQSSTATPNSVFRRFVSTLVVYGDHPVGLVEMSDGTFGVPASEAIAFACRLAGLPVELPPSADPLMTQAAWPDPVPPGRIVDDALQLLGPEYELAVWEGPTAHLTRADLAAPDWIVRTDDLGVTIEPQGDTAENRRNGVIVVYDDIANGPSILRPDSHPELRVADPNHPANRMGVDEWGMLELPFRTDLETALQLGVEFLAEENRARVPVTVNLTGYVRDVTGTLVPANRVRPGDALAIADAPYDRPRLVKDVAYDHDSRRLTVTCEQVANRLSAVIAEIVNRREGAGL